VPRIDAAAVPRIDATAVPRIDATAVPRIDATAVPRIDAAAVPRIDATAVPRTDATAVSGDATASTLHAVRYLHEILKIDSEGSAAWRHTVPHVSCLHATERGEGSPYGNRQGSYAPTRPHSSLTMGVRAGVNVGDVQAGDGWGGKHTSHVFGDRQPRQNDMGNLFLDAKTFESGAKVRLEGFSVDLYDYGRANTGEFIAGQHIFDIENGPIRRWDSDGNIGVDETLRRIWVCWCMSVCLCLFVYIHTCVSVCFYVYMYGSVFIYTYMYVYVYAHKYISTHML
jgi:hypothetical protein